MPTGTPVDAGDAGAVCACACIVRTGVRNGGVDGAGEDMTPPRKRTAKDKPEKTAKYPYPNAVGYSVLLKKDANSVMPFHELPSAVFESLPGDVWEEFDFIETVGRGLGDGSAGSDLRWGSLTELASGRLAAVRVAAATLQLLELAPNGHYDNGCAYKITFEGTAAGCCKHVVLTFQIFVALFWLRLFARPFVDLPLD